MCIILPTKRYSIIYFNLKYKADNTNQIQRNIYNLYITDIGNQFNITAENASLKCSKLFAMCLRKYEKM